MILGIATPKKFFRSISNAHVVTLCAMTFLITVVLGFIAPYLPLPARESLAFATGWFDELTFLACIYIVIRNWNLINSVKKYFVVTGTILLALMYGLWLFIDYGSVHPNISAIGFNIATSFRSVAICALLIVVFKQQEQLNNKGK